MLPALYDQVVQHSPDRAHEKSMCIQRGRSVFKMPGNGRTDVPVLLLSLVAVVKAGESACNDTSTM